MVRGQPGQIVRKTLSQKKKKKSQKRADGVAQGLGPEFKPQYCNNNNKKILRIYAAIHFLVSFFLFFFHFSFIIHMCIQGLVHFSPLPPPPPLPPTPPPPSPPTQYPTETILPLFLILL
jgi:hypothetical protein